MSTEVANIPEKETTSQIVKHIINTLGLEGVGVSILSSVGLSFADVALIENFVFGVDGMNSYESVMSLGVGCGLIFLGEFRSMYAHRLRKESADRLEIIGILSELKVASDGVKSAVEGVRTQIRSNQDEEAYPAKIVLK